MHLEVCYLNAGIQDETDEVDTAVVETSVPLVKICKASLKCGDNLCVLWVLGHAFPLLLHCFNDREHTVNCRSGGM